MKPLVIGLLSLALGAGCAMQPASSEDRVGVDGQPIDPTAETPATAEGASSSDPVQAAGEGDCNSPDPQPWNCPNVHPNTNSGNKTNLHDVYGNAGSDTPGTK